MRKLLATFHEAMLIVLMHTVNSNMTMHAIARPAKQFSTALNTGGHTLILVMGKTADLLIRLMLEALDLLQNLVELHGVDNRSKNLLQLFHSAWAVGMELCSNRSHTRLCLRNSSHLQRR